MSIKWKGHPIHPFYIISHYALLIAMIANIATVYEILQ